MDNEYRDSISALGIEISAMTTNGDDFISLTDIAKYMSDHPDDVVKNWMRNRSTIEFLGLWEKLNNPNFKPVEFDGFKREAGANHFVMTPSKWISSTDAIGIRTKRGRYGGGTFAHSDIAFEFASWISPAFKLYIIKDYKRLKADEGSRLSYDWSERRLFSKLNYQLHTAAVKEALVPNLRGKAASFAYATEADVINVALFGKTAQQWRNENPTAVGNMRDHATLDQLVILANLESMNAELLRRGMSQPERAEVLNAMAVWQFGVLRSNSSFSKLPLGNEPVEDKGGF